jgi:hypothetical protein
MPASGRAPFWARPVRGGKGGAGGGARGSTGGGARGSPGGGTGGGADGSGDGGGPAGGTGAPGGWLSRWARSSAGGGSGFAGAGSVLGWIGLRVMALLAIAAILVGAAGLVLRHANDGPVAAWARSSGHDGLWLGHAWLDGRSPAGLRRLAAHIHGSGIADVYVFAGGLDTAGRLTAAGYAGARGFLASFRAACPGVRVSAWLGGVVGPGHIDLGDAATRRRIVASAAAVLHAGFTGVHYDLGPVTSGDPGLLELLSATRQLRPDPLSVAAPKLEPLPGMRIPARLLTGAPVFWAPGYLAQVAGRVDQVAVLGYDTGMPFPSWYGGYVERETALALRAVPRRTALLIGVPAFHGSDLGHHAGAETVAAAIHGIRVALTAARPGAGDFGVALFAGDSATSLDWASYVRNWARPG